MMIPRLRSSLVSFFLLSLLNRIDAFLGVECRRKSQICRHPRFSSPSRKNLGSLPNDAEMEGPEQSQMGNFISQFLQRENGAMDARDTDQSSSFTHMIGIPLDQCDELLLELESVQRAILYHCPVLVHACLAPARMRLPLLYVNLPDSSQLAYLEELLRTLIQKHLERETPPPTEVQRDGSLHGSNSEGIQPVLLQFQGLDIVQNGNSVLYTRVDSTSLAAKALLEMTQELQEKLNERSWSYQVASDEDGRFQVPFMRLPRDWKNLLPEPKIKDDILTSDEGGNGISPIFWFKWSDDIFGEAVRMREVAIYPRQAPGLDESAFTFPLSSIPLPRGSPSLDKHEAIFAEYQQKRLQDAEASLKTTGKEEVNLRDDPMLQKTRERLESLLNEVKDAKKIQSSNLVDIESVVDEEALVKDETIDLSPPRQPSPTDMNALDDWTKERIRKMIESKTRIQRDKDLAKKKSKPPIVDNEVFRRYKEGTMSAPATPVIPARSLPPYPSREHCSGFWKIFSSPTGFDVEEDTPFQSDNLILRIDGTTAGGPILDQETRQKASGGTWKLMMGKDTDEDPTLRIRLVIPPKKERILVMEGSLERMSSSDLPLARRTFGIPELEARAKRDSRDASDVIYCRGSVWIEDAVTSANRDDIGSFAILKLATPNDPGQYTITIPKSVRNFD